uniref:VWFC domain-containing protein n=2 Tax=Eptatretus burgeri TaxID=7764 RepID=A0A8C4WPS2_EPTBU
MFVMPLSMCVFMTGVMLVISQESTSLRKEILQNLPPTSGHFTMRGCMDSGGRVYQPGQQFYPGSEPCPCLCTEDGPVCEQPDCPRLHPRCVRIHSDGCCPRCGHVRSGCELHGLQYAPLQELKPSPCKRCRCEPDGAVHCVVSDCPLPDCVDPIYEAETCCPVCKHGANCLAGTRTIPAGTAVRMDACTICSCDLDSDLWKKERQASCVHQVTSQERNVAAKFQPDRPSGLTGEMEPGDRWKDGWISQKVAHRFG